MWSARRRNTVRLVASNETIPSGRVEVEVVQNGGPVGCSLFEMLYTRPHVEQLPGVSQRLMGNSLR